MYNPTNFNGLLPKNDIDFSIDVELRTQPVSIQLYHINPTELKELKEKH